MSNKYIVTFKDRDGNRRSRVAKCSIFADFGDAIISVANQERLPLRTYIYTVKQGMNTYIIHDLLWEWLTPEQRTNYRF